MLGIELYCENRNFQEKQFSFNKFDINCINYRVVSCILYIILLTKKTIDRNKFAWGNVVRI